MRGLVFDIKILVYGFLQLLFYFYNKKLKSNIMIVILYEKIFKEGED